LFLVVFFGFYKPLRNCHPSQQVSKVQRKKVNKNISVLRFYVEFFKRFYVKFLLEIMFF